MSHAEYQFPADLQKQVRVVSRHIGHHSAHSGYDVLFDAMGITPASTKLLPGMASRLPYKLLRRLYDLRPQPTERVGLQSELNAMSWVSRGQNRLCHFVYGEDTYFYTPLWRSKANKMLATIHFPAHRLAEAMSPASLRDLDAAVVVSTIQLEYLSRFIDPKMLFYVPHQVDAEFFAPPARFKDGRRVLFVGEGQRDFETLGAAVRELVARDKEVRVDIVAWRERHAAFAGLDRVHCHAGIDDTELRDLYQRSSVGLLPLRDCTANNAVVELMSCGKPMVVTEVGGVRDYVDDTGSDLCAPKDASAMVDAVIALLDDPAKAAERGAYNRQRVEAEFAVPVLAKRMEEVYRAVLAG